MSFTHRIATEADIPAIVALMDRSISGPLAAFLTAEQIVASRVLMGLDSQIIADRTSFIVARDAVLAGCGGWSRRLTPYGGDPTPGRDGRRWVPAFAGMTKKGMRSTINVAVLPTA